MTAEVVLLASAKADILAIQRYVARHGSPQAAARIIDALERLCANLAELPERGNVLPELAELGIDVYREIHHRPYRIVYRIRAGRIVIYAVLDARRDLRTLLEQRLLR